MLDSPDELACDMQRTYGIDIGVAPDWCDYRGRLFGGRPINTISTLATGLLGLEDSLIYRKAAGLSVGLPTLFAAAIVDRLSLLLWAQTKKAKQGKKSQPTMLTEKLVSVDPGKKGAARKGPDGYVVAVPIEEIHARLEAAKRGRVVGGTG